MEEVTQNPQYNPNDPTTSLELLEFKASLSQDSGHTGATLYLKASVTDNGELAEQVKVGAKVLLPDGSSQHIDFEKVSPGHFKYAYKTTIDGEYKFFVHAKGTTHDGREFNEERTLRGSVYTDFT